MRPHPGVASFLLGLLLSSNAAARAARLTDEDVERLLESIERDVRACEPAPRGELEAAARAMRQRFDDDSPANDEVLHFVLMTQSIPEGAGCAGLRENVARLSEVYHVNREMAPLLWRARRMNDAELERALVSLGEVAVPFTRELEQVAKLLDPCTVVEGECEAIVARAKGLGRAAEALRKAVEKDRDASAELDALLTHANDVRTFLERHSITRVLRDTWGPVERDLSLVTTAFGVGTP